MLEQENFYNQNLISNSKLIYLQKPAPLSLFFFQQKISKLFNTWHQIFSLEETQYFNSTSYMIHTQGNNHIYSASYNEFLNL